MTVNSVVQLKDLIIKHSKEFNPKIKTIFNF
ncbi:hypothetical protein SAMN04489723_10485 [Algoriphagus aquimarinus]|uniref:Uncharacterized protein n=1 Tax=Algoriphagus aquimarinus TaxID=237018 RepID=A0A1I0Y3E3_9BACT|nr:hypothetical protein SAMN04489723_10485 [Algoriphagus aquimarinus]